jgi:hypothetical protein
MRILLAAALLPFLHGCAPVAFFSGGSTHAQLAHEAKRVDEIALDFAGRDGASLSLRGVTHVAVEAVEAGPFGLVATWTAGGRDEAEARTVLDRYRLVETRDGNAHRASVEGTPLRIVDGATRMEITPTVHVAARVPHGTAIDVDGAWAGSRANGPLGEVTIRCSYGAVEVSGARGPVRARSASGAVKASDVEGALVDLASSYGSVTAERITAQKVSLHTGSGAVRVESVRASEVSATSSYGPVAALDVQGATVLRSGSGSVRVDSFVGDLEAHSSYGSVEAVGTFGKLALTSGSGSVTADARTGSDSASGWNLSSSYGKVRLLVADDFEGRIDASTSYGNVDARLSRPLGGVHASRSALRGAVGTGGGDVVLKSGSGSVAIESGSR